MLLFPIVQITSRRWRRLFAHLCGAARHVEKVSDGSKKELQIQKGVAVLSGVLPCVVTCAPTDGLEGVKEESTSSDWRVFAFAALLLFRIAAL